MKALPKCHDLWQVIAIAMIVSGCLGSSSSSDGPTEPPVGGPPPAVNRPPAIAGTPASALLVDEDYDFRPTASDPDGDALTFSIQNRPAWAAFDSATGRLYGRPDAGDVGRFSGIAISVSDGDASDSLDHFSIAVNQFALGSVTVSWTPPTTNADGSAIADLAGFRIYYGRAPDDLDAIVVIDNPGTVRRVIENLSPATWYFSMTSFDGSGVESVRTPVGSRTLN
ncbi:MAG: putative Ig domain-containing protein [Steroidobacteraceae bacterium]